MDISSAEKKAEELLEKVDLSDRKNHYIKQLSGGEQQRVTVARAFANEPDCIIADEPTGNLDEENEIKIFELLKQYSSNGKCVICVSHSSIVEQYSDITYVYKKGEMIL
jgi:ABC-type lipoprotein export system ATPase subunit